MNSELESVATAARAAIGNASHAHGSAAGERPRFELFHAATSICSQKVRVVLLHHGLPFLGHTLNLFNGDTYLPEYVRLRMIGCRSFGGELVARHSGSTSAEAGGCDGAVVPTLVDWDAGQVIVDSKRICVYLDEQVDESNKLRPPALAAVIDRDLAIIDNLPNYQMLMGRNTGATESAATRDGIGASFSERKVAWCDRYLRERSDEATLVAAYTAKRAKELSAAHELFSADAMSAAYDLAERSLADLERKLEARATAWLYGDRPTMSDLFWGIELLRMKNVGVAHYWEQGRMPNVARYLADAESIQAIKAGVIDWPGAQF